MDEARRKLEIAAAVGAPHSVAGPPHVQADRELGAKHYRELLELGRQFGVKPSIEYLGFVKDFTTIEDALGIMQSCGDPTPRSFSTRSTASSAVDRSNRSEN